MLFDTLLDAKKVAPKAHALKTIVYFKNHNDWVEDELKSYIEKNFKQAQQHLNPP